MDDPRKSLIAVGAVSRKISCPWRTFKAIERDNTNFEVSNAVVRASDFKKSSSDTKEVFFNGLL